MSVAIDPQHVMGTCRAGQGSACCRYLTMGAGMECAKPTPLRVYLDSRVERGQLGATGDNCSGPPDFTPTEKVAE